MNMIKSAIQVIVATWLLIIFFALIGRTPYKPIVDWMKRNDPFVGIDDPATHGGMDLTPTTRK